MKFFSNIAYNSIAVIIVTWVAIGFCDSVTVSEFYATIRAQPHGDAQRKGIVKKGESFKILSHSGEWFLIEYNKSPAWINEHYIIVSVQKQAFAQPIPVRPAAKETTAAPKSSPTFKPNITDLAPQQPIIRKTTTSPVLGKTKANQLKTPSKQNMPGGTEKTSSAFSSFSTRNEPSSAAANGQAAGAADVVTNLEQNITESSLLPLFVILGVLGVGLIILVYFYFAKLDILGKRGHKKRPSKHKIDAVIIGRTEKHIHNSLTNADTVLAHYLTDLGCKVHQFTEIDNAKTFLERYVPDVVVVDWQLAPNVQSAIEAIFLKGKLKLNMVVIFFNVADPTAMRQSLHGEMAMEYLGIAVSDQDLSRIITPLLKEDKKEKRFMESVQTSALEGEIQHGSLSEVLQFIEMGRKNGCLYLTENSPLGLIYFEQGRIYYAATPANQGIEAVVELLDLEKGHFHFVMDKQSDSRNINSSTLEIVMEWTRRRDEAGKTEGEKR